MTRILIIAIILCMTGCECIRVFPIQEARAEGIDCSGTPHGQPTFIDSKFVGCIGWEYKYEKPLEPLYVIKIKYGEIKDRTTSCEMGCCKDDECMCLKCKTEQYRDVDYEIGTGSSGTLFTVTKEEKP